MPPHKITAALRWRAGDDFQNFSRFRWHMLTFRGEPELEVGEITLSPEPEHPVNPLELYIGALSSAFMLTYLDLCALNELQVAAYTDEAQALLTEDDRGRIVVEKVQLSPRVKFAVAEESSSRARALFLIREARNECFVIRSTTLPLEIEPFLIWT